MRVPSLLHTRSAGAAAAVLVATTLLSGCLGKSDDKKDSKGAPAATASKPPIVTMPPAPTPPAKSDPSASRPPAGTANPNSSPGRVKMVKLHKGDCINQKGEDVLTVACTTPHDAEVVGEYTIPDSLPPTSMKFKDEITAKCTELTSGAAGRNSTIELSKLSFRPTSGSWLNEHDRDLTCLLKRTDGTPLTAPLK